MALPIKAVPTLYGYEARRMMKIIEENERKFEVRPEIDRSNALEYIKVRMFFERSKKMNEELRRKKEANVQS